MERLNEDLSKITTIPIRNFNNISLQSIDLIGHYVAEAKRNKMSNCEVDIGVGRLLLKLSDDKIVWKFIPSITLENKAKSAYKKGNSPIVKRIEDTLAKRMVENYKELFK